MLPVPTDDTLKLVVSSITPSKDELSLVEKKAAQSLYLYCFKSRIHLRKASVLQLLIMDPNSYFKMLNRRYW